MRAAERVPGAVTRPDESIGRSDFVALGERVGVTPRATEHLLDELLAHVDVWIDDLADLPFDRRTLHELRRAVDHRREWLRQSS